ncbi:hypothetical protein [Hymenobacter ruber]
MPTATTLQPRPTAPPEQPDAAPPLWPSDVPRPVLGAPPLDDAPLALDDSLTEAAGMARNDDALGPYAGSF